MANVQKQLLQVVSELRIDLIKSFALSNRVATGSTERKLEVTATNDEAQLTGPWWIYALQEGRKPTKPGTPAGNPTLREEIAVWCEAKGIDVKLSYIIAKHIHEHGYPGTPGIIDVPLSEENVDRVMTKQLSIMAELFQVEISNSIYIPQEQTA
jgi:hypothetical protein